MLPVILGLSALGAGTSYFGNRMRQKQEKMKNLAAAEQTRWSPWTDMGSGQQSYEAGNPWIGALQGAVGGAKSGSSLSGELQDQELDAKYPYRPQASRIDPTGNPWSTGWGGYDFSPKNYSLGG